MRRRVLSEDAIASMVEIPFGVKKLGEALRGIRKGDRRPPRPAGVEPIRAAEQTGHLDALSAADPATAAHGLQPWGQCVSWIYDLTHNRLYAGLYCLFQRPNYRPCSAYQKLAPGRSFSIPFNFTEAGIVQPIVKVVDVSSGTAIELAILDAQGQEKWRAYSTRIAGAYTMAPLEAPGSYTLRITNPRSADASLAALLDVTMYGDPAVEFWLRQYIEQTMVNMVLKGANISMAPMGIAVYGVKKDGDQYSTYILTTDAVKGAVYIPPDISASGYESRDKYFGQAFSVQLNAFVVARLMNGKTQYYWVQNFVGFKESKGRLNKIWIKRGSESNGLKIWNNIHNMTTLTSTLDKSRVRGKGKVWKYFGHYAYVMPGSIPFGRVELETRTRVDDGKIIVEFYAKREERDKATMYDKVTITPDPPATSAYIKVAPTTTPRGYPLNLELVFGGYLSSIPWAVLESGQIGLELYVRMNGAWVPPPSAWSVGSVTAERSYAGVVPQGVGSALVVPGAPNPRKLW